MSKLVVSLAVATSFAKPTHLGDLNRLSYPKKDDGDFDMFAVAAVILQPAAQEDIIQKTTENSRRSNLNFERPLMGLQSQYLYPRFGYFPHYAPYGKC